MEIWTFGGAGVGVITLGSKQLILGKEKGMSMRKSNYFLAVWVGGGVEK